jgi:hypothetical protein
LERAAPLAARWDSICGRASLAAHLCSDSGVPARLDFVPLDFLVVA